MADLLSVFLRDWWSVIWTLILIGWTFAWASVLVGAIGQRNSRTIINNTYQNGPDPADIRRH